ncbi:hypothetical protein EDD25_2325 [Cryobacterium psychrophilum]|nr:hypothetical protein EDD25_2325 [Cryobacterium psychrophilum]
MPSRPPGTPVSGGRFLLAGGALVPPMMRADSKPQMAYLN